MSVIILYQNMALCIFQLPVIWVVSFFFYIILNLSTYQQLISIVEIIFLVFVLGTGDGSFTDCFF